MAETTSESQTPKPDTAAPEPAPKRERLPFFLKLCYGVPTLATAAMAIPLAVHMPRFYSDVVLAPLGYIAIAIAVARAFDAITDPAMGWLSDRTRTAWGRRKPWIALGVPCAALSFWALFSPPESLSTTQASLWFGIWFAVFFLFHTIFRIPYNALGAELSLDYKERSSLFGVQSYFIVLGTVTGSVLPSVLQNGFNMEPRASYSTMGLIYAVLVVLFSLPLLFRVRERSEFMTRESNPLVPGIRRMLRNRPFRLLVSSSIVSAIPAAIPGVLMPYMTYYVAQPENPEFWLMLFLLAYFGTGFLCLPIWVRVAQRIGKIPTHVMNSCIGIIGTLLFFTVGPGDIWRMFWIEVFVGIQSASFHFLVPALGADTIDYDELRTGKRREGQYGSFWALIPKLVAIPSAAIPLAILGMVGYIPNQLQTPQVIFAIKFMFAIAPCIFYFGGVMIIIRYPISEIVHKAIREGIAAHARGEAVTDPLTNKPLPPPDPESEDDATGWLLDYFSSGELRRLLQHGSGRILRDVAVSAAISFAALGIAVILAIRSVSSLAEEPGILSVFWIVCAGFALTTFLFHVLRIGPARRMAAQPVHQNIIEAHLDNQH